MPQIGTFARAENGEFRGTIRTITLNVHAVIRQFDKECDLSPDY